MMTSKYKIFDRDKLRLAPLEQRIHDLSIDHMLPLAPTDKKFTALDQFSEAMIRAKRHKAASIMMIGGHVIRSGTQNHIIDLMRRGFITCLAVNGACAIHDFELSLIGATTESVQHYIETGQFGLWHETGQINEVVNQGAAAGKGFGEALGAYITEHNLPYADTSILANAYQMNIPVTVHVGIGYDIIHEHPNFDGGATGKASYHDFLIFVQQVSNLHNGTIMNFGSAVMGPEIFLKALAMARNIKRHEEDPVNAFTTLVCDLKEIPETDHDTPPKNDPLYYFRPLKTMLVRSVKDSGRSFYVKGDHRETIPALWTILDKKGAIS